MARQESHAAANQVKFALDNPSAGWLSARADPARPRSSDMLAREDEHDGGTMRMRKAGVHL